MAVEAAEFQRQPSERPDQCELRRGDVNNHAEPRLFCVGQAKFGFVLHFA